MELQQPAFQTGILDGEIIGTEPQITGQDFFARSIKAPTAGKCGLGEKIQQAEYDCK
jgi:hypothetical protein